MSSDFHRATALVTGGTGFVGQYLTKALLERNAAVTVLSRHPPLNAGQKYKTIVGDLVRPHTLEDVCQGMSIVFHLGGYAHAVDELDAKGEETNREVTVEGTRALLEQSINAGVSRFLFFSSVKAIGEGGETRIDETMPCQPVTSYGKVKHEAEQLVLEAARHGLPSTILRLPMVYGPGCKGNLPRMIQAVARGYFPPLPETGNRRSMVDVRDVVQAALMASGNPAAAGKTYIVTDSQAYSTRQIYEWICAALARPVPRWTVPLAWLHAAASVGDVIGKFTGRRFFLDTKSLDKLIGSAWYSSEKISRELGYRPIYALKDALPEMVAEYEKTTGDS